MMTYFMRKFQFSGQKIGPFTFWDISMVLLIAICNQYTLQEDATSVSKMFRC